MNWYKESSDKEKNIISKIKNIIKNNKFFTKIMKDFHVPVSDIDNHLKIEFYNLDGKYAEGNGEMIRLHKEFLNSDDFFNKYFHFVVHEFYHWVKRRSEDIFYFNDPEEVEAFTLSILWELINGKEYNDIYDKIYPIIKKHYKEENDSLEIFKNMLEKAKELEYRINKNVRTR